MITGDKQETAINIAISCRLFKNEQMRLVCNASNMQMAKMRIRQLKEEAERMVELHGAAMQGDAPRQGSHKKALPELVVDGKTLVHILHYREVEQAFASLSSLCSSVVVCRASPS